MKKQTSLLTGAVHLVFLAVLIALNEIETTSSNLRLQFIPLAWCAIELFQVRVALLPTAGEEESSTASRWWGLASNLLLLSLDIYFIYEYLYFKALEIHKTSPNRCRTKGFHTQN